MHHLLESATLLTALNLVRHTDLIAKRHEDEIATSKGYLASETRSLG